MEDLPDEEDLVTRYGLTLYHNGDTLRYGTWKYFRFQVRFSFYVRCILLFSHFGNRRKLLTSFVQLKTAFKDSSEQAFKETFGNAFNSNFNFNLLLMILVVPFLYK